jgi:SAM-dependent methyltransferase
MNPIGSQMRQWIVMALKPRGKLAFLRVQPHAAKVLDVGCGNNSPREFKTLRPDFFYTGLDVGDYNQQGGIDFADAYVVTPAPAFAAELRRFDAQMDTVVSAHNLEHCDEPEAVLEAMLDSVRPGGNIYLAFPCEESVGFPSRRGCLNFYDDHTHKTVPSWDKVLDAIHSRGWTIEYSRKRYRPWVLATAGLLLEPIAALSGRNVPGGVGWALYGFESIIWARREAPSR